MENPLKRYSYKCIDTPQPESKIKGLRKIAINVLVFPDFKGEESEIKEILEGKSKHGEVSGIVLLDPIAFHQVSTIYLLEEVNK